MCASFPDRILKLTLLFAALAAFSGCAAYGPTRQGEAVHRDVIYAEREGRSLHLDLYLPPRSTKPAPVVVWFHGGSWKYGDKGFSLQVRDLTRQGFAVASVQYRLIRQDRWPAQIEDATAAVDWLRANAGRYGLDGKRIGLSGESAGGQRE